MTTRLAATTAATLALAAACGASEPEATPPELVVADASMGVGRPVLLGVSGASVYWSAAMDGESVVVAGTTLDALPSESFPIATSDGPIVQAGDHVLFASGGHVFRAGLGASAVEVAKALPDTLGESRDTSPILAWTNGATVTWESARTVTLAKTTRCESILLTAHSIYVTATGLEPHLIEIDRATGTPTARAGSSRYAASFPGGGMDGATYRGRLVAADDGGALWLVEESPSKRAILVSVPEADDPVVLLEHITNASAFFVADDAFYWQEGDALLTAPREGGAAAIAAQLSGQAGAIADGFVYFVDDDAIVRLPL